MLMVLVPHPTSPHLPPKALHTYQRSTKSSSTGSCKCYGAVRVKRTLKAVLWLLFPAVMERGAISTDLAVCEN